jgi:hypothetical protein
MYLKVLDKEQVKPKTGRQKETVNIRADINEMENKGMMQRIGKKEAVAL